MPDNLLIRTHPWPVYACIRGVDEDEDDVADDDVMRRVAILLAPPFFVWKIYQKIKTSFINVFR